MEDEALFLNPESNSMASVMIGRVINTLLSSRPKKLESAVVKLGDASNNTSGAIEDSLRFLMKYVRAAVEEDERLDDVLVPMIENSLQPKESKVVNQAMILLNWLFQDVTIFRPLARALADIISRREDRYFALGWCGLIRSLVEYEKRMTHFLKNGIRDNYRALLMILASSISHLSVVVHNGSLFQDGFELPTRLSIAAADCILVLTGALTRKPLDSRRSNVEVSSRPSELNKLISVVKEEQMAQKDPSSAVFNNIDGGLLLWQHFEQLIILVQKLHSWSQKSRPLHAIGLGKVLKWLQEIEKNYICAQHEAGAQFLTTGVSLLSSCWRHYSMLSLLEDSSFPQRVDELVEQYLSGIQFYTEGNVNEHMENRESCTETRKFFLNCLALLLGRMDYRKLEATTSVYGLRMSNVLLSQLHCADGDVVEGAVCILRSAIFKITGTCANDPREMEMLLPPLLNLLGERDAAARAAVVLIAEYCIISRSHWCLQEVRKRFASGDLPQRKNAADVISELIRLSSNSENGVPSSFWQDIANQLLECLKDEEISIRAQAISLLPFMDPSLVLPTLVRTICLEDGMVKLVSSNALVEVLKCNNQKFDVISVVLDSLSNLYQTSDHPQDLGGKMEGSPKFDRDGVFKLLPEWSNTVQDWNFLVVPLIDKMLSEPSNATIIRFLSSINEHIADAADLVLQRLLSRVQEQEQLGMSILSVEESETQERVDGDSMKDLVFDRLCPLLILKILPLRIFNNLNHTIMYGQVLNLCVDHDYEDFNLRNSECVATSLFKRAFCRFEYEDVRKLAAELCGRLHPQVLFPVVLSELRHAAEIKDFLNMKACLFAICTSLVVRGWDSVSHPCVIRLVRILQDVLLWPSLDVEEVTKVQHGCIDCLALMVCAELQAPRQIRNSVSSKPFSKPEDASTTPARFPVLGNSVLAFVMDSLANDRVQDGLSSGNYEDDQFNTLVPISFRLCMANVLISTCQKISESGKKPFVLETVRQLIQLTQVITDASIRAACVQTLFSASYHLKSRIEPYVVDLLRVSLDSLRKESEKERMAGAKLLASLMASEDLLMEKISVGMLEARSILQNLSTSDPSPQLRQMCQKLLLCMTSQ